jgi:hypothetical protein
LDQRAGMAAEKTDPEDAVIAVTKSSKRVVEHRGIFLVAESRLRPESDSSDAESQTMLDTGGSEP